MALVVLGSTWKGGLTMFRCEHCNTKIRPGRELCEACAQVITRARVCACGQPAMDSYATCEDCHSDSLSAAERYYGVQ